MTESTDEDVSFATATDLAGRVCPDGRFSDSVEGVANARPDGIHFSDEAASRLSEWLGPEILGDA